MTLEQQKALEAAIKAVDEHYGHEPVWRLYGAGFAKTESGAEPRVWLSALEGGDMHVELERGELGYSTTTAPGGLVSVLKALDAAFAKFNEVMSE